MIYLDYAATCPVYKEIQNNITNILTKYDFNPSAKYGPGVKTKDFLSSLRNKFALYLETNPKQIIFTSSATESINTVLKGINLARKNKIIVCNLEHKAVLETVKSLKNAEISYVDSNKGYLEFCDLEHLIDENTKLVSLMHVNNETGAVSNVTEISKQIKKRNPSVLIMSDMVQSFGKIETSLKYLDFAIMSSHKIGGLKGASVLFVKNPESLQPLIFGGGQEFNLRGGTENIVSIWSMTEALKITKKGFDENISKISYFKDKLEDFCNKSGFLVNTPEKSIPWIFNFSTDIFSEVLINHLSSKNIFVSSASACSGKLRSHVLKNMKLNDKRVNNAIRISMNFNTSEEDIEVFCNEIISSYDFLI
jgi:cysteine desulfurase